MENVSTALGLANYSPKSLLLLLDNPRRQSDVLTSLFCMVKSE